MKKGSRASGTNPRALGTNKRAMKGVMSKAKRMGWNPAEKAGGALPRWLRFEILKRDGFRCSYCGARSSDGATLQVDHIKPKAAGGTDAPANLTTACGDCNAGKAARKLNEGLL
ncbi:HNH endonuclease [Brevundimonas sp. CEF1]|uniref:HNH endonuclease n=1 Tax=Brevundimonas sp. CEF1 TaxID=3442642 RepID=UPI003F50DEDE